jgi:hypothetical protein
MSTLFLPFSEEGVVFNLPGRSPKITGVIEDIIAVGHKRSFDNRSRVFKLVGDNKRYLVGYSCYRESVPRIGDTVQFTRASNIDHLWTGTERSREFTVGVSVVCIEVTSRAWWRVDGLLEWLFA